MRKSTRLSAIGLAQAPEPVKPFSTRFSLRAYAKRVQQLTPEQRSAISRTGFGNLLSVPNHTLNKVFLTELMDAWSCDRRAFALRSGGEIGMTPLDVALILGLPVAGNPVNLSEDEPLSDLEELYGATKAKRKVAMAFLENRLELIGDVASDDFVRSFLLYTIGTFLSSNDGKVDSRFLRFLEDLGEVSGFAWGGVVVDDLCYWLDKRKEHNVQYVGGCLIFLQTWSYEHFDVAARPQLQDHDLTFPRVCRWDSSKSNQRQRGTPWFKDLDDDQVIWKLEPTSEELQIEVIKEALGLLGDNKELQSVESSLTSTPSSVHDEDSRLQLSINNEVHRVDNDGLENQVVEDTPERSSFCDEEFREQVNPKNLIVLDTTPNLTICGRERSSFCDEEFREQVNPKNLIVLDTTPNLTICGRERSSFCDEEFREQVNPKNLIVLDTPPNLTICGRVSRVQEMNLENPVVVVEETPTVNGIADEVGGDQEFTSEKLMEDTLPKSSFSEQDDLRKENGMLEEENSELKMKIGQVMEENELLRRQVLSNTQFEEQNAELKKELDLLREEIRNLRLSTDSYAEFADRVHRNILDLGL
ncbi:uncharacterized protein LOC109814143 isoform X1 [Cajanus cajan]|uniref:uncharacterized protein LOC109814143 isoform X1 n=1 Tax=Cajanus cajan TaxID=3821 RepID=UPI00098DAB72|nr:uncharacterized protein LOC109814143 isoform X1 [Cajanus cajan]